MANFSSYPLPLPALLSQTLVAFTLEFDSEFERQMPHRTTTGPAKSGKGPWLVSMVMWSNFLRFVPEEGVSTSVLRARTGLSREEFASLLERMSKWWGYVVVEPPPTDSSPRADKLVRPTSDGRKAQTIWEPLFATIEARWRTRFGAEAIDELRESLSALIGQMDTPLPESLPIIGYGLFSKAPALVKPTESEGSRIRSLPLSALLAQVLLAFALDFERDSPLSLAICANAVRLLSETDVPMRDLPRLSGVSKEGVEIAVGYLERHGYAVVESDAKRVRQIRLTSAGLQAKADYQWRLADMEAQWGERFGGDALGRLRLSLERLVGEPKALQSPLFAGLEPPSGTWRAALRLPEALPHYPMVLHRGGYPDGS